MDLKYFTVLKCENGHSNILYGSKDDIMEDFKEDYELDIVDGEIIGTCDICGEKVEEIPYEKWSEDEIIEVLGDLLEDDNRHGLIRIGRVISDIMKERHYSSEQRSDVLQGLLKYYSKNHRFS